MSSLVSPLSPSPHVQLLEFHHRRRRANSLNLPTLTTTTTNQFKHIAPSPEPNLSPNKLPNFERELDLRDGSSAPFASIPLPQGWSYQRQQSLRRPSEERCLPTLKIEPTDSRLLRRGLYIACAVMYFPELLNNTDQPLHDSDDNDSADSAVEDGGLDNPTHAAPVPALEPIDGLIVPKTFHVSVVEGGITNQLYKCSLSSHPDNPVLIRIYGPRTELVIDRSLENDVVDVLSRNGSGPKIWGRFENGRLESWLLGTSCTPSQMSERHLSSLIAGALAKLHLQPMPFERKPVIENVLHKWSRIASEVAFPDSPTKQQQLNELNLPEILIATRSYLSSIAASHYGSTSPVVFCHNDLLSGNIMYAPDTDTVALVDFEYGNYNPRGFDLANHFCECCGFDCDWSVFPTSSAQLWFIRHYLASIDGIEAQDVRLGDCHQLYAESQCWLLAPHLFWCLWAVTQSRYSPIDFDYLTYANQRWKGFQRMKAQCQRWLNKTKEEVDHMDEIEEHTI